MLRTLALLSLLAGPAAQAQFSVRGQVLDPAGEPLAGAEVSLVRSPTPWERMLLLLDGRVAPDPEASARSGEGGWFELTVPESDVWELTVSAPGYVPMSAAASPLVEETMLEPVELVRDDPLVIRVVDADGGPLPGVWVSARGTAPESWPPGRRRSWSPRPIRVRTSSEGRAILSRRTGDRLDVTAYPRKGPPMHAEVLLVGETLRVAAAGSRTVRLVDDEGAPLAGAVVSVGREEWPIGRTGIEGELEVQGDPESPLRVTLVLADGRRARLDLAPGSATASAGAPTPSRQASDRPRKGRGAPTVVRPEAPRRLRGRVVDARTREPLGGALVYAGTEPSRRTRTGADGSFELVEPAPGSDWLAAAASGHSPAATEELDRSPLILLPPAWTVRGIVLDATREPIPGAHVVAFPRVDGGRRFASAWGSSARALAGSDGSFELSGLWEELAYTVAAELPAVGQTEEIVRPDEAERLLYLVLATGATLSGQVVDDTDAPVPGATLRLGESREGDASRSWSRAMLDPRPRPETTSDPDGAFAWEHLRPGSWDLVVNAEGYAEERVPGIELEEGRARDLGLLRLATGTPLEGRVQDADGAPLEGAVVHLIARSPSFVTVSTGGPAAPDAVSDADGHFSLPDRRPGEEIDLLVQREGFVPRDVPGVVVGGELIVVELEPAARLSGTVLGDDGGGVAGATVMATTEGGTAGPGGRLWSGEVLSSTASDDEGRFELGDLPAARLTLRVEAGGWLPEERSGLEVSSGDNDLLTIRLRRGASVEGRVFGADGAPVADAAVGVVEEGLHDISGISTDADGHYRLEGVEPGTRLVSATAEDGRSVSRELEVVDGVNSLDLVFEPGWSVTGVVVDEAGEPVADALLTLTSDSSTWGGLDARADLRGAFAFEDVHEGTYWLRGSHPDFATTRLEEPVTVRGPVAGVQLRLSSGARVAGALHGLEESELRQTRVFARDERTGFVPGRVSPDGGFVIPALAPGEWTLIASAPDGRRASEVVSIAPGEREVRVDLSFVDGYTLSGTILLDREPLAGAQLVLRNQDIADSAWGRTDHRGRFEIRGLEPGRYGLVVSRFETGLHHQEELLLVDDDEVLIEIERRRVSGRVVDAVDETPVAAASIRLQPRDVDPALFPTSTRGPGTRSDSSGAFSLGSVAAGLHELSVTKDGYGRLEQALEVAGDVDGLILRLEPTEGLALRVRLPDGNPARQVSVVALDLLSGQPIDGGQFLATSEGDVRLPSLPPGRWILLIGSADAAVAEVTLTAPGEGESLQLGLGTRVEVVVPSLTGPVVPAATVALERPTGEPFRHPGSGELRHRWSLWNGRATVENLPSGPWIVRVEATDGRRWDETVAVQAGGVQSVEID